MESHPPHGSIYSLRDFLLQLITITAGVLIALSLEGLLEWNHYRTLVREAREMISREIADNKKEVDVGYSRIYALQDLYADHQRQSLERLAAALAILSDGDPHLAAPRDLEAFRQHVLALRAGLVLDEQIGRRLAEIYRTALEH